MWGHGSGRWRAWAIAPLLVIAQPASAEPASITAVDRDREVPTKFEVRAETIEGARKAAIDSDRFQSRMLAPRAPEPSRELPQWLQAVFRAFARLLQGVLKPGLWVAGLILGALLLYVLVPDIRHAVDRWLRRRRDSRPQEVTPFEIEAARDLLAEAEALAAAGRFGEASQLLLTRSVEEIARWRPGELAPADTARAIATSSHVPPRPRSAFARLAAIVERVRWARADADARDWEEARAAWAEVVDRAGWRAAAA